MKFVFRKPSLKKSLKARTVGKAKRKIKKAINPAYGKKGMGLITNPKKSLYNKVYNKTSFGISDILKNTTNRSNAAHVATNKSKDLSELNPKQTEKNFEVANPKFHRTKREEELAEDFFVEHYEQIQPMINKLVDINQRAKDCKSSIIKKIELCNKAISAFYDLKKFCSRSKGGALYFADGWEHCNNSQNEDFSFIEETERLLEDLQLNYNDYDAYFKGLKTLKKDLLKFIADNPSFLQKDIYKHFHPRMKYDIQSCLRKCEKEGLISREKKGSSYILNVTPLAGTQR